MEEKKSIIQQASINAKLLVVRLQKATVDDLIDYAELSQLVGCDVQHKGRGALETARRIVMRQDGKVFEPVRGVGLKCLSHAETVQVASIFMNRTRNLANRTKRKLDTITDPGSLDSPSFAKFALVGSMVALMKDLTKEKTQKKIEGYCESSKSLAGVDKVLEYCQGKS
jgi:hypothetical protein